MELSLKNEQESWSAEKKKHEDMIENHEKQYKDKLQKLEEKIVTLVSFDIFHCICKLLYVLKLIV